MNFRARIILAALAAIALVYVSSVAYFVDQERRAAVARLQRTVQEDARLLQVVIAGPLYDGNLAQLDATLDSVFANPDMLEIELKETRGDIAIARKRAAAAQRGERIEREVPIVRGRDRLGTIHLAYSTANIEQRLMHSRDAVVRFSVLLMAVMSILVYLLATRLTRPIARLTTAAQAIAQGDLEHEIDARGKGELAVLGQSFVRMRDAMREKISDLGKYNQLLLEQIKERTKAESALRASEERFSKMFREAPVLMSLVRVADGTHVDVNREFEKQTGLTRTEALGRTALELGLWDRTPAHEEALRALQENGNVSGRELQFKRRDGEKRDTLLDGATLDLAGETCWLLTVRDITEQKNVQQALRSNEARLKRAETIVRMGHYAFDADGANPVWSDGIKDIWGFDQSSNPPFSELVGRIHTDDVERVMTGFALAAEQKQGFNLEYRIVRPDATVVTVHSLGECTIDQGDGTTRYFGTMLDITERKAAQEALYASEAKISEAYATLNDAIESAPAAIAIYDAEDKLLVCNSQFKAFFAFDETFLRPGVKFRTLIRKFTELGQVARPQRVGEEWLDERERQHLHPGPPLEIDLSDGRWLQITETRASNGGIVSVYNDITELKRREEELEIKVEQRTIELATANKELEAFAYSVSHDLRAPLRGIDGFSQVLVSQHGDKLDPEARRLLLRIRAGAQRMGHLISDLLELSRVARSAVQRVDVDLSALAQAVVAELGAEAAGRALEWQIEPGMAVHGDRGLLRIALVNLLGNALKYTRDAASARIEFGASRQAGDLVEFHIRDNGAGFDMAYADRLFLPFQRLHAAHEFEGSGIGLATVLRIIAKHGGTIRGEGRPGAGATFYFTIPA